MATTDRSVSKPSVWKRPGPLGLFQSTSMFVAVVAPLLAGFSLAAAAILVTTNVAGTVPMANWALASFSVASVLFVFAIQYQGSASGYAVPPEERLGWWPEATVDPAALQAARQNQAEDFAIATRQSGRAGVCYDLALLAFLTGLALLVVPTSWSIARIVAVVAAVLAGVMQVLWIVSARFLPRGWLIGEAVLPSRKGLRGRRSVHVQPLAGLDMRAVGKNLMEVVMSERQAMKAAWPRNDPELRSRFTAAMADLTGWTPGETRLNAAVDEMLDRAGASQSQEELKSGIAEIITRHAVSWPRVDDRIENMVKDLKAQGWIQSDP
jgi:hypothetical protein